MSMVGPELYSLQAGTDNAQCAQQEFMQTV